MRALLIAMALAAALSAAPDARAQEINVGGPGVWDTTAPATPRHWFTGMRCWESAADVPLSRRIAFEVSGIDVGCSYESATLSVTLYATFRPGDEPIAAPIAQTRAQMTARYGRTSIISDEQRTISTSAGELTVDEFILSVSGTDSVDNSSVRGATGAWHADVGDWTLKLRLTRAGRADPEAMRILADALLGRAYAEMQTARDCEGAGLEVAPNLNLTSEESVHVQVGAGLMGVMMSDQIPADPAAARAAGFVCVGDAFVTRDGRQAISVLPPANTPRAQPSPSDLAILAIGEIYGGSEPAPMIAVVDMSMNPFLVENLRGDRGHFVFSRNASDEAAFYGALDRGALRQTAAQMAAYVANGGAALVTVGARPAE